MAATVPDPEVPTSTNASENPEPMISGTPTPAPVEGKGEKSPASESQGGALPPSSYLPASRVMLTLRVVQLLFCVTIVCLVGSPSYNSTDFSDDESLSFLFSMAVIVTAYAFAFVVFETLKLMSFFAPTWGSFLVSVQGGADYILFLLLFAAASSAATTANNLHDLKICSLKKYTSGSFNWYTMTFNPGTSSGDSGADDFCACMDAAVVLSFIIAIVQMGISWIFIRASFLGARN